jgi:gamma-glutamylcyclotransferase (GGCT)/AIG2-like uncharacterized protein YtfP
LTQAARGPHDSARPIGYVDCDITELRGTMLDRLFVYGTLMHGYDHPMARLLSDNADYLGPASMPGRLYRVKHYPALIASDDPAELVYGDVFRLHRPDALLPRLDDYEGCGPGSPQPPQYRREVATVALQGGATVEALVYVYNLDVARLTRIASGRFQSEQSAG